MSRMYNDEMASATIEAALKQRNGAIIVAIITLISGIVGSRFSYQFGQVNPSSELIERYASQSDEILSLEKQTRNLQNANEKLKEELEDKNKQIEEDEKKIVLLNSQLNLDGKSIVVYKNEDKISIDGKLYAISVDTFEHGGNIYVPLKIAEEIIHDMKPDNKAKESDKIAHKVNNQVWLDNIDVFFFQSIYMDGNKAGGWYEKWDGKKDSLGNTYDHGIYVRGYRGDTEILDYVFDVTNFYGIKGKFTLYTDSRNTNVENTLKISSIDSKENKTVLYTSPVLKGGVKPIPFDVEFSNIEDFSKLRIEISSAEGDKEAVLLGIVDACLY